jgi:hypothetical protein
MAKRLGILKREPIAVIGVVAAIIPVLIALGVINATLGGALGALVVALGAIFGRSQVASLQTVTEVATQTAQQLGEGTVGTLGNITTAGVNVVKDVVGTTMGVGADVVGGVVGGLLGEG